MPKRKYEVGNTYNGLKILSARYKGTALYYTVECQDCGGVYEAQIGGIRNGCKLCRTERNRAAKREEYEKMIGQQYGDLIVVAVEEELYKNSMAWQVRYRCANCGHEGKILPYKLRDGIVSHCPKCTKRKGKEGYGPGICYDKRTGKYQVSLYTQLYAGTYNTVEEAIQARDESEKRLKELWKAEMKSRSQK